MGRAATWQQPTALSLLAGFCFGMCTDRIVIMTGLRSGTSSQGRRFGVLTSVSSISLLITGLCWEAIADRWGIPTLLGSAQSLRVGCHHLREKASPATSLMDRTAGSCAACRGAGRPGASPRPGAGRGIPPRAPCRPMGWGWRLQPDLVYEGQARKVRPSPFDRDRAAAVAQLLDRGPAEPKLIGVAIGGNGSPPNLPRRQPAGPQINRLSTTRTAAAPARCSELRQARMVV